MKMVKLEMMAYKIKSIFQQKILMHSEEPKIEENIFKPRKIVFPKDLESNNLKKVYAGGNRSCAVFQNEVVSWGDINFQATESSESQNQVSKEAQQAVIVPIKVGELALGSRHTFAYGNSDENEEQMSVYCWGSNKSYELGLQEEKFYGLEKVDLFDEAFNAGFILKEISCGDSHTMTVFKDQLTGQTKLFGWGESKSYQLALDTTSLIPYPVEIDYDFTSSISKIYSKSDYNIAILNDGDLYSWGSNMFNRLGLNQSKKIPNSKVQSENPKTQNSPNTTRQALQFLKNANSQDDISFTDRRVLNAQNTSNSTLKVRIPRKIQIFNKKVHKLALGTYHVIALTQEGQCFSWGNGIYGQLGNNKFGECPPEKISTKHLPSNVVFVRCSAGERHSCLLDEEGNVYTCGTNAYGVLGHQKHENQQKNKRCKIFEKIDYFEEFQVKICQIASGDRHILALSESKQVYGWGSNKNNQVILNQSSIKYVNDALISKEKKQSRIKTSHKQDFQRKICKENHVKFSQEIYSEQMSESKLMSMQMKQHLHNLPQKFDDNQKVSYKLRDWKERFSGFLMEKRRKEDEFMKELESIINQCQK